jgi:hypothetical protein
MNSLSRAAFSRFWCGVLIGFLLLPLAGHYAKWLWLENRAAQGTWYEDKMAKAALLAARPTEPDVVFVGASTTQNHIDTVELAQNGIDAFNYGVPGMTWEEYPYMVSTAAEYARRLVVINISHFRLQQPLQCPKQPTSYDIWFYLDFKPECLRELTRSKWNGVWLWRRPFVELTEEQEGFSSDETNTAAWMQKHFGFDLTKDARKFNFIRGSDERKVVIFGNGDGLIFTAPGVPLKPNRMQFAVLPNDMHPEAVAYLKRLLEMVGQKGLKPVILLDGAVTQWTSALADYLRQSLGAAVIDNTGQNHPQDHWADPDHYNIMGVRQHTQYLQTQLAGILRAETATRSSNR